MRGTEPLRYRLTWIERTSVSGSIPEPRRSTNTFIVPNSEDNVRQKNERSTSQLSAGPRSNLYEA